MGIGIGLWPLTTGVFPSSQIEFGVCNKIENVVITNFFVFATLFASETCEIFLITRNVY